MESEDQLISWLKERLNRTGVEDRIGDDAAVLPAGGPWVTTMDTQIEGVHFRSGLDPSILARRLWAVNASDIAAMGADPCHAFLSLSAPQNFDRKRFFEAFLEACGPSGTELAGGDLSSHPSICVVLTLIGRSDSGRRFLRRDEARPGHDLWLGDTSLGESALGLEWVLRGASLDTSDHQVIGLPRMAPAAQETCERSVRRHLLPEPQLGLGRLLSKRTRGAAMDISDGLSKDLHRLCRASGVGAVVHLDRLVEPQGWSEIRHLLGKDAPRWLDLALGGGEDYILCFTLPTGEPPPSDFSCLKIGSIRAVKEIVAVDRDGASAPLPVSGWDHLSP